MTRLSVSVGQCSTEGRKEQNQDCIGVQIPNADLLGAKGIGAVIADGVSVASGAKIASEMCVQGFLSDYFSTPDTWSVKRSASTVLNALNRWLYGQSNTEGISAEKGYVSTLSALVIHSNTASIFHIGDTRIVRVRNGSSEILTRDHSSRVSAEHSYLNRAMGLNLEPKVDYLEVAIELNDIFVLTSDGVHDWVNENELLFSLSKNDLDFAAEEMVQKAYAAGSKDNLTCLFVRVDSLPKAKLDEVIDLLKERPFPPILAPGMKLDGLEVEEILFENSRSQLYRVSEIESGRDMVMKTPSPNFRDDLEYIERFVAEEWVGKRMNHPNLLKVVDRESSSTFLYYLMEYVPGVSLKQFTKDRGGALDVSEVVKITEQVVSAVRALHRKDTLHQDLKPDNILISSEGDVMVIDYGSCRVGSMAGQKLEALGTMDYGAPEYRILQGGKASAKSDQFSIGMIVYRTLTGGASPYGDRWEKASTLHEFLALSYIPSYHVQPLIPHWIDGALKRALSVSPEMRYPSLSEFIYDLKQPNSEYQNLGSLPLIDKNPLLFWKSVSLILSLLVLLLLIILFRG